jgi:diadenosine tetraphosphate (Ap4A) HIT family hydrolase
MRDCAFCSFDEAVLRNELAYARFDRYPVSPGHLLVLTLRHVATWFEATDEERAALLALIDEGKRLLDERHAPDGYNIGINVGEAAGQTVVHLHVHLIPRYRGDVADPRGGVRGVIPQRQHYPTGG